MTPEVLRLPEVATRTQRASRKTPVPVFAARLRQLRLETGLSQRKLAALLGINRFVFTNYESGEREPFLGGFRDLCLLFGVSADWLLGLTDVREITALEGLEGRERRELDEKGRLVIPADFRRRLRLPVVLHAGAHRTLELWDLPTWTLKRPDCIPPHRDIPDADTGRITLPEWFRHHARLYPGNTAYLAGAGHFVRVARSEQLAFPEMQR